MLVMTCGFGGTIRIGEEIQVTLQGRSHDRVSVSVITPAGADLQLDQASLRPFVLPSGMQWYCFTLKAIRRFCVSGIVVGVWLPGEALPDAAHYDDCVHVGIAAPDTVRIAFEQGGDADRHTKVHPRHLWN